MRSVLTVAGTREERIGAIARLQRGRVARPQLLAAGIGPSAIGRMIERGWLLREQAGVYAVAHTAPVPLADETVALLACGGRAFLSHRSAAVVWGLIEPAHGSVEVTVAGERTSRHPAGVTVHRARHLLPRDVRIHQRLPATSPARTLLDLAAQTTTRELERAVDEAVVVQKIVRLDELKDVVRRAAGRREGPLLAAVLDRRGPAAITQSEAEERFLQLVRKAGLPEPQTQVKLAGFEVDFLWPEHRVAFEIDGYRFHTSRYAFDRDRRKDAALKALGIDPNRVSRDQVKDQPLTVLAYVAAALARAPR